MAEGKVTKNQFIETFYTAGQFTITPGSTVGIAEIPSQIDGKTPMAARIANYNTNQINDYVVLSITQWYSHTYVAGFNPRSSGNCVIPEGHPIWVLYA